METEENATFSFMSWFSNNVVYIKWMHVAIYWASRKKY